MTSFRLGQPYHEERPWGSFDLFIHNKLNTVKIITVNPGESTSLQLHHLRQESWIVIAGTGVITIGLQHYEVKKNDAFTIPKETVHQLTAGKEPLVIVEISTGKFDEQDIVRIEDKYQRNNKG